MDRRGPEAINRLHFAYYRGRFYLVSRKEKHLRALMLVLLFIGAWAFVVDVIDPTTPDPLVLPRLTTIVLTVFSAISVLLLVVAFHCSSLLELRETKTGSVTRCRWGDVRRLTCVRLL